MPRDVGSPPHARARAAFDPAPARKAVRASAWLASTSRIQRATLSAVPRNFFSTVSAWPAGLVPRSKCKPTSPGMAARTGSNDGLPLPLKLQPGIVVFDIVPKPAVTPLLAEAARAGCRFGGGRLMIDCQ